MVTDFEINTYPWESDEHKEAYLGLLSYENKHGLDGAHVDHVAAFLILKQIEAQEYWRDAMSTQVSALQTEIQSLQNDLKWASRELETMSTSMRLMSLALNQQRREIRA